MLFGHYIGLKEVSVYPSFTKILLLMFSVLNYNNNKNIFFILETALGVKLDKCLNGDEYRESFKVYEESFNKRVNNAHLLVDPIYKLLEEHKYLPAIRTAHNFSSDIIAKRRQLFEKELQGNNNAEKAVDNDEFG